MTVSELITLLQALPQDVPVSINDECNRLFHDVVGTVLFVPDCDCVVLCVNEE